METGPDSHCSLTAGCIPAPVKCLCIIKDAESRIEELLAMVQTFATEPIHQTAGMVIVKERHLLLMQPLQDGSYLRTHLVSVHTTNIIPISATQGAVHCLPLTLQPDSMQLYSSNTIHLNCFNFFSK